MNRSLTSFLKPAVIAAALATMSSGAQASVIFEDNFDANNFHSIWTVTDGGVDVGNYGNLCNNQGTGTNYCVDTEGTGAGTNATFNLTSAIANLVAGDYTFSFDWGNNDGQGTANFGVNVLNWSITADQGSMGAGSINSGAANDFSYANASFAFSVLAPVTNAVITFAQVGHEGDWGGTVLDNVKLELDNAYAVPAPAPLLLLGMGLFALGAIRSRRS